MLSVSPEHLAVVRAVLCRFLPAATCYAFGSRTRSSHHPYSDLPFRVDGVNLNRAGADFVRLLEGDFIPI